MDKNERNEHFKGFAELVAQELRDQDLLCIGNHIKPLVDPPIDVDYEHIKTIIAQRAYDLAYHAIDFLRYSPYIRPMQLTSTDTWIDIIPDLTSWPKTASQSSAPDE